MKKILLLFVGILLTGFLSAQTLLSEDFSSGEMPPDGWLQLPLSGGWYSSQTSNAGGAAPECKFEGFSYTGMVRLISSTVNMSSVDTAVLSFKHNYNLGGSGPQIGIAIRGGGDWTTVWSTIPSSDIEAEEITIMLTGDQISSSYFQFCFFVDGSLSNVNGWFIDDVELFTPVAFDTKISSLSVPGVIMDPTPVGGTYKNVGLKVINDVNISWVSYGGIERDSTFTDLNLEFLETFDFNFDGVWASPLGVHDLKVWINTVNGASDENQENDTIVKPVEYQAVSFPAKPLYEEFTSSTCAPCASFNSSFVPWTITNADDITLLKYQMNWPGAGDPYYTAEGGSRRTYYGVNAVPDLMADGINIGASTAAADNYLSSVSDRTSTFDIKSSFTMTGNTINITTNVLPFASASGLRLHNVIFEKVTTDNVASNGETEFHHVMMKMMPSASGASPTFVSGVPQQFTYSYDMSTTNVEEMDDLEVVVFIQDNATKSIVQSAYGPDGVSYSNEARLSDITLNGVSLEGFDPDIYEYTVDLPESTVEEPGLLGIPMHENALTITNLAFAVPGTATIDIFAENRFDKETYTINYNIWYVGDIEKLDQVVSVYPNPANDMLNIKGLNQSVDVSVVSTSGAVVLQKNNYNGGSIDISSLSRGAYFVRIRLEDNQILHKKVIIL